MSDPVVQQMSVKGKLFKSIQHRQSLGSPDFILSVVRNGHKIPFISTPPPRRFTNNASVLKEEDFVIAILLIKPLETHISRYVFGINHEKSNWEPSRRVSWIGYNIDTHTGLIFTSDTGILESFALTDLNEICASLEFSTCVHLKNIASIFGQTISMSASCGNVTQVMTRYLHLITNSRSSWNFLVCVDYQAKQELHFWGHKLKSLNVFCFGQFLLYCPKSCLQILR